MAHKVWGGHHLTGKSCSLKEAGFEFVIGEYSDGGKIFKKRK
ncbi:MAG: hypothetical protein NWF10_05150 [Candidatus Bathyarchaeota archaeon]|nr:hypothetical protein [Candidatus Bathyarchaeota archaeon]